MSTAAESNENSRVRSRVAPGAISWGLAAIFAVMTSLMLHHDGVSASELARYGLYVVWALLIPGLLVRRALWAPARSWLAEISLAVTTGLVLELVAWAVCVGVGMPRVLAFWPVLTLCVLIPRRARHRVMQRPADRLRAVESVTIFASAASLLWLTHVALTRQMLPGRGQSTYPDLLWHMGLVHEARRSFPLGTPQVIDSGTLHYHWFSDAHMAAATLVSGVPVPVEVLRLFPATFYLLMFATSVAAARQLTTARWALVLVAPLAAATTTFMPFPWLYSAFSSYSSLSPSQLYAGPLMVLAVLSIVRLVGAASEGADRADMTRAWIACLLSAAALGGAKASAPPSLLGGVGLLWLWSLAARRIRAITTVLLGIWCLLVVGALTLVAGGDSGTEKQLFAALGAAPVYRRLVSPKPAGGAVLPHMFDTPWLGAGLLLGLLLTLCLIFVTLVATFTKRGRHEAWLWVFSGTFVAALVAFLVMRHLGLSEFYFVMGVLQMAAISSAVLLAQRIEGASKPRAITLVAVTAASFAVGVMVLLVAPYLRVDASGVAKLLRSSVAAIVVLGMMLVLLARVTRSSTSGIFLAVAVGLSAAPTLAQPLVAARPAAATSPHVRSIQEAASWIDAHVPDTAVLATNEHCVGTEREVCSSREWWFSGLGGRRVLVEGWSYTPQSANDDPFFDHALLERNQRAFTRADDASLAYLRERGVSYLVAVKGATPLAPSLASRGERVFANESVSVYRIG